MQLHRVRHTALALSVLLFAACSSAPKASTKPASTSDEWIQASPILQREIDDHAATIPYLQKVEEFGDEVAWFVRVGEPAYPTLFELARDPDEKVAGFALAVFAARGDARVVPSLDEIPWPAQDQHKLRYERARCHVKLGDWKPIGILVDGLDDPDLWSRAQCFKALSQETGKTFDYHPKTVGPERAEAIARWRAWLAERDLDPMLQK